MGYERVHKCVASAAGACKSWFKPRSAFVQTVISASGVIDETVFGFPERQVAHKTLISALYLPT